MERKRRTTKELYEAMADAIKFARTHPARPLTIDTLAGAAQMERSRFEHAFTEWVGISPKRFLAHLSKERVKKALDESKSVLSASYRAGLSSPGRLHDLLIAHEGVTPGEYKTGIVEIRYGIHPSPFGWCLIGSTKRGISTLFFLDGNDQKVAVGLLRDKWPKAELIRDDAATKRYAKHIFDLGNSARPLPLVLAGTNFQIKVWEALLAIPEGQVVSYADLAARIGSPKAVRAVGTACGRNPIGFLIPCHRVLTSSGGLGGYRWGTERKEAILAWESLRARNT